MVATNLRSAEGSLRKGPRIVFVGFARQPLPGFFEWNWCERVGPFASRNQLHPKKTSGPADSRLQSFLSRVSGGTCQTINKNLRPGSRFLLQQWDRGLGRCAQAGSRLRAHTEQQWPQVEMAPSRSREFIPRPHL